MEAHRLFNEAAVALEWDRTRLKGMWAQFWASHQRFFKYLCIAAKVPQAVKITQKAIADGKVKVQMSVALTETLLIVCSHWSTVNRRSTYSRTAGTKSWNTK